MEGGLRFSSCAAFAGDELWLRAYGFLSLELYLGNPFHPLQPP